MPGLIKVGGSYRTTAVPYVKVGGTWKTGIAGWVKVAGAWRQWYAAGITDTFNRSNSSTLGTASDGYTVWNSNYRSSTSAWAVASNVASNSSTASTYPMATVVSPLGISDYILNLDIPSDSGAGLAFWVSSTSNWWAAVTNTTTSVSYSCPSGGTLSGSTCSVTSTTSTPCSQTYISGANQTATTYPAFSTTTYTDTGIPCASVGSCTAVGANACINGNCANSTTSYYCNSGDTLSGTTCTNYYFHCESGGSLYMGTGPCGTGGTGCYTYTPATSSGTTTTYAATATTVYAYSVKLLNSVSGTVTTKATYTTAFQPRSLKVTTTNNNVSVISYSAASQSGTSTSNTYAATSPTKSATVGIVLATSGSTQATTVENFSLR